MEKDTGHSREVWKEAYFLKPFDSLVLVAHSRNPLLHTFNEEYNKNSSAFENA